MKSQAVVSSNGLISRILSACTLTLNLHESILILGGGGGFGTFWNILCLKCNLQN
jgi:hypothetical protein